MSSGIFENGWLRSSIDKFQAAILKDVNQSGLTRDEAIVKDQNLLVKNDYTYVEPEQIRSLEFGYRGSFLNEDLTLDLDFYYNRYTDFIAQVEMNVPKTTDPDSIPFYLADRTKQDRYRMWTNSKTIAYNYGAGLGIRYELRNFSFYGNVSYAHLDRKSANDGLEDGFNTPEWTFNTSISNDKVYRNFGFNVSYRWQKDYYWQSFLVNGQVPAYGTFDLQVTKTINHIMIKLAGSNLLNQYYRSFLGGPSVGGFYYATVSYNLK
jgi:iron complex outermembrane receptor protein